MQQRPYASLLLITASHETAAHFAAFLPADRFAPELSVCSALEAPYVLGETVYDVVVIDGTVPAEEGAALAARAAENGLTACCCWRSRAGSTPCPPSRTSTAS